MPTPVAFLLSGPDAVVILSRARIEPGSHAFAATIMQPTPIMEAALAKRLRSRADLRERGASITLLPGGGVGVSVDGRQLGSWRWTGGQFTFEGQSQDAAATAQTIMGATAFTAGMIDELD